MDARVVACGEKERTVYRGINEDNFRVQLSSAHAGPLTAKTCQRGCPHSRLCKKAPYGDRKIKRIGNSHTCPRAPRADLQAFVRGDVSVVVRDQTAIYGS